MNHLARWIRDRRWWLTIVPPYAALAAVFIIGWNQSQSQAEQARLAARQAVIAADLAKEHAAEAREEIEELEREAARSCSDRQEARSDLIRAFELTYPALPPRIAVAIDAELAELEPITC